MIHSDEYQLWIATQTTGSDVMVGNNRPTVIAGMTMIRGKITNRFELHVNDLLQFSSPKEAIDELRNRISLEGNDEKESGYRLCGYNVGRDRVMISALWADVTGDDLFTDYLIAGKSNHFDIFRQAQHCHENGQLGHVEGLSLSSLAKHFGIDHDLHRPLEVVETTYAVAQRLIPLGDEISVIHREQEYARLISRFYPALESLTNGSDHPEDQSMSYSSFAKIIKTGEGKGESDSMQWVSECLVLDASFNLSEWGLLINSFDDCATYIKTKEDGLENIPPAQFMEVLTEGDICYIDGTPLFPSRESQDNKQFMYVRYIVRIDNPEISNHFTCAEQTKDHESEITSNNH